MGEAVMGRWGVLAIRCLARVSMGLHPQVVAAVSPFLIADLGLSYGEVGTLIGIFLLPGVILSIPGGLIRRRFGDTRTLIGAVILLAVGTALLAASSGFWMAVVARLIAGAGGTLLTQTWPRPWGSCSLSLMPKWPLAVQLQDHHAGWAHG